MPIQHVHSSSFYVPGQISTSQNKLYQNKFRLLKAKQDSTSNEWPPSNVCELEL